MAMLPFYKFDGAGNDFVLVDERHHSYHLTTEQIAAICHRRFGVGADGLMTLSLDESGTYDFVMKYYNSDGNSVAMCGNGGRCIVAFAQVLEVPAHADGYYFLADDGPHQATMLEWDNETRRGVVRLGMKDVSSAEILRLKHDEVRLDGWFLNTGVPHYVQEVEDLESYDVVGEGRRIRQLSQYFPEGTNVNFIHQDSMGVLHVRTYERGVEDETWACGTGVTACAIVTGNGTIKARGGDFKVEYSHTTNAYTDVFLTGPVSCNFMGSWPL